MKLFFVCWICLVLSAVVSGKTNIVEEVNSRNVGWIAGDNDNEWNNAGQVRFGWKKGSAKPLQRKTYTKSEIEATPIPTSFVSAKAWPVCRSIGTIYNQARCGSCWAFGGVEAAMDRLCISTKGAFNEALSFAQAVECDSDSDGCEGGSAESLYSYLQDHGVVTNSCYPYNVPTCKPSEQPCLNFVQTPNCWTNRTCQDGTPWKVYKMKSIYSLGSVTDIQIDIMKYGPVEACFSVYEDFLTYKSGVYSHVTGDMLGGHCVKIQGWGVENNQPYWLANNQWTTYWGDKGQFKILRGKDECGIEDDVVAGIPEISN